MATHPIWDMDMMGRLRKRHDTTGMQSPVECTHCGACYDMGLVTVTARYADCSCWTSPCCQRKVDDRTHVSLPGIRKL